MDEEPTQVDRSRGVLKPLEKLGLALLLIIMVVSTLSTAVASQQAKKAANNTDILATCFTPGTSCANILAESSIRTTAENKCVIDALINLPPLEERKARRDEVLSNYDDCVKTEIVLTRSILTPSTKEEGK